MTFQLEGVHAPGPLGGAGWWGRLRMGCSPHPRRVLARSSRSGPKLCRRPRASWLFPVLPCTSGVASEVCDLGLSCAGGDSRSVCPGCGPVPTGWAAVPRGDGGFPLSFVCPAGFLLSVNFGVLSILYFLPVHQHI